MNIKLMLSMMVSVFMLMNVAISHAGEHAHFAAFFNNGSNANFSFPAVVEGDNVEQDMMKIGAEMLVFAHSAGVKNGDMWTLQNNTLRETSAGNFQDFGLDCKLSMYLSPFKVGGLCSVFMSGSGSEKVKSIIKPMQIKKEVVWYKIFEDKKNGMAGYFMRETAADFNH